jgi:hypothetical protein
MTLEPAADIEVAATRESVQGCRIITEQIGHTHEITSRGKIVSNQSGIDELVAEYVGEKQDSGAC